MKRRTRKTSSKKFLLFGALFAAATWGYNSCNQKPSYIHKMPDGAVEIDYAKTTNFSLEDRDKIKQKEISNLLSGSTLRQQAIARIFADGDKAYLRDEFKGRWCSSNKCFLVKGRNITFSNKINDSDEYPGAFFIPESENNGRKWHFYFFLDPSWKDANVTTFQGDGLPKPYNLRLKRIGEKLFYSKIDEDYSKFMPLLIRGDSFNGGLPSYMEISENVDMNFEDYFVLKEDYEAQRKIDDPQFEIRRIKSLINKGQPIKVDFLHDMKQAIEIYRDENGNTNPPSLQDLVPKYIERVPNYKWKYIPSSGVVEIEK